MVKKGIMLLLLCSLAVSLLAGCSFSIGAEIVGNGKKVDNYVNLSSTWSSIEISDIAANVYLSNEQSDSVKYSIDENLEKYLDITENNGILVITSNKSIRSKDGKNIDFYIGTSEITDIKLSESAVKLEGIGEFVADKFTLEIDGAAADVTLNMNCNNLKIDSDGASTINLQGKTEILNVQMVGAGKLFAKDFKTLDATIDLDGISEAEIYAEESLHIIGNGAIKVTYWGEPQLSQDINGMGDVKKGVQ